MKTSVTNIATALCVLTLASCIRDKFADSPLEIRFSISTENRFTIADDPITRAPIYSAEAAQSVTEVRVHVFRTTDNGATYLYLKSFDISADWNRSSASANHSITRADMLAPGSYRFLAVGIDAAGDYTIDPSPQVAGTTPYSAIRALPGTPLPGLRELFSGYADRTVSGSILNVDITMTRRVSGTMLYVSNVPTTLNGQQVAYLRLRLSQTTGSVDITSDPADSVDPADVSGPGYNVFDIDLRTQGDTSPADGLWDGSTPPDGVVKLPATTLAGAYLLPGMYTSGNPTMTLSLMGADNTTVLKSWSVLDVSGLHGFYIWPNYLYSLGRKLQRGNTNNGTPNDTTDDDAPIDLSRSQTANLNTSTAWGGIYLMSLQDN